MKDATIVRHEISSRDAVSDGIKSCVLDVSAENSGQLGHADA